MSVRPILEVPNPALKKKCEPVGEVTSDVQQLIDDMFETMYDAPGIGLAAPQVGIHKRLLVLDIEKKNKSNPQAFIDPEITWFSKVTDIAEEGCLSLPGQYADVKRPKSIKLTFTDRDGVRQEMDADDLLARCLQHEVDHLNGILFVDHLSSLKRGMILRKLAKSKRLRAG